MWRSLVARVVRDDEVAGSNPVIPTKIEKGLHTKALFYCPHRLFSAACLGKEVIFVAPVDACRPQKTPPHAKA